MKGIYVTGPKAGSAGMEELIGLVDETELNAMVIDVKNDEGNVTFRLMNEEITQNIPVLTRYPKCRQECATSGYSGFDAGTEGS
ncbi:MAG: putative glycoside hydrolase [Waltera sp.]